MKVFISRSTEQFNNCNLVENGPTTDNYHLYILKSFLPYHYAT